MLYTAMGMILIESPATTALAQKWPFSGSVYYKTARSLYLSEWFLVCAIWHSENGQSRKISYFEDILFCSYIWTNLHLKKRVAIDWLVTVSIKACNFRYVWMKRKLCGERLPSTFVQVSVQAATSPSKKCFIWFFEKVFGVPSNRGKWHL